MGLEIVGALCLWFLFCGICLLLRSCLMKLLETDFCHVPLASDIKFWFSLAAGLTMLVGLILETWGKGEWGRTDI